jgi:hypothetical protein
VAISILTVMLTAANCNANSGFHPIAVGGDGASVQFCVYLLLGSLAHDH